MALGLRLEDVKSHLEKAIRARSKRKVVQEFVKWLFGNVLTSENVAEAFQLKLDLTEVLRVNCHLDSPVIQPLAKLAFRLYWREIEDVVCNVDRVHSLLLKVFPEHSSIFSSKDGVEYLNVQCQKLYDYLYSYTWS